MSDNRYKLMIVDDEYEIRQGLRSFDYSSYHIDVVADCENGLFALQTMMNEQIDLLVTDIRMPLMDGLELAEKVASRYPHMKIIVLSGYDDFEYARTCMKHGSLDYLLKPLDFEDYGKILARAVRMVEQERVHELQRAAWERKAKLSVQHLRKRFLRDLLYSEMKEDAIELESSAAEIMLEEYTEYVVCLLRFTEYPRRPRGVGDKDWALILFTLDNLMQDLWGKGYHYVDADGQCALIWTDRAAIDGYKEDPQSLAVELEQVIQRLKRFRGLFKSKLIYTIGTVVQQPNQICRSYQEAAALFRQDDTSSRDLPGIEAADPEEAACNAEQINNGHRLIQEAKQFIEHNYDRTITLDDVAEYVHLNASYLSFLFKELTGQKYIDYITSFRIEKAKSLLRHTNHKVHEVGEMVGYENPRYFTLVFKKYNQLSPLEYRNAAYGRELS
ncbi:response regulator [Paenibacillus motobuensis]|uniref:response regulator n=1 Tax=Paenibacillus TaxID=44249 RepID=UPI00204121FA|nr:MULTISPECIES: response regulator [Paenibacillus]MCM3042129.1 response regulator [Paenibacillus lutimineralis]MCM3649233.1 response regulator [Paenibacillus motobuensis]